MSFATEIEFDGRLLWWGLDVCTAGDDFATVQYRWANMAGDVGANHYQERIASLGNIQRGLGNDHLPIASTVEIIIDNTDFVADFLVNRATVETGLFKARFRLWVGVDDGTANTYQANLVTQQVGVFVCLDFPQRNAAIIRLSLTDDALGKLSDLLVSPTLADWRQDAGNTANNALFETTAWGNELVALTDFTTPLPLQFGANPYVGVPMYYWSVRPTGTFDVGNWYANNRQFMFPIIVAATRDTATIQSDDVLGLRGVFHQQLGVPLPGSYNSASNGPVLPTNLEGSTTRSIPETFTNAISGSTYNRIWKSYKTQSITKDGVAWKLLWIAFDMVAFVDWCRQTGQGLADRYNDFNIDGRCNLFAAFERFEITGRPCSGVQGQSVDTYRNPANIMFDFVESYSKMGAGSVDSTRFLRARNAMRMDVKGSLSFSGVAGGLAPALARYAPLTAAVSDGREVIDFGIGQLRKAIAELARSCDLDVWITQEGKVGMAVMAANFETQATTYPTVDEARITGVVDTIPSQGQRWAPYNRVFLKCPDGRTRGPFDDTVAVAAWGKIISRTLDCKWWWHPVVQTFAGGSSPKDAPTVKNLRFIEAKARPVIQFTTDVGILALELADYFLMSWTRGGESSVYASTLWRLEAVTISPKNGAVDVTAVWMGDLQTTQPFLLDTESMFIRTTPAAAQTLTLTTGSTTVTRSAGSFITDGVATGDVVRLRDSNEAATTFVRNRDVKVVSVTDALNLVVADSAFGSGGPHVLTSSSWAVYRSYLTYPTVISDPTNYANGGAQYGKICNSVGQFSDAAAANELLDG